MKVTRFSTEFTFELRIPELMFSFSFRQCKKKTVSYDHLRMIHRRRGSGAVFIEIHVRRSDMARLMRRQQETESGTGTSQIFLEMTKFLKYLIHIR